MKRTTLVAIVIGVIIIACTALIIYQQFDNQKAAQEAVATNKVSIQGYAFKPQVIKVKVGTTVTWINNDAAEHTINSYDGSIAGSHTIAKGQTYSHTFTKAGTYKYHCTPHPNMTGSVIVTE